MEVPSSSVRSSLVFFTNVIALFAVRCSLFSMFHISRGLKISKFQKNIFTGKFESRDYLRLRDFETLSNTDEVIHMPSPKYPLTGLRNAPPKEHIGW